VEQPGARARSTVPVTSARLRWWTIAAAGLAPVLIIGGWALAEALQPAGYDPLRDTISALASPAASYRWVMTAGLAGAGLCYLVVAEGLTPARSTGRIVLAIGGVATVLVAAFPQPTVGNSVAHTVAATVALVSLASWSAFGTQQRTGVPLLSPVASAVAVTTMLVMVAWFALELHGGQRGLAERVATGTESLWPFAVVITTDRAQWVTPRPPGYVPSS
jgi:hypothetical membrane protein